MPEIAVDCIRLLAAAIAGAVIGLERELHDKPAGFRTNILICVGAALFTLVSIRLAGDHYSADSTRIAAQVVTGVGFLGAGAIIQFRGNIIGLTTAATIWTVASVGMAFGAGEYFLGAAVTGLATVVLLGLSATERYIARFRTAAYLEIVMTPSFPVVESVERRIRSSGVFCKSWTVTKTGEGIIAHVGLIGPEQKIEQLQADLIREEQVRLLKRL